MLLRILIILLGISSSLAKRAFNRKGLSAYGKWAVITGASDGIGKAISIQLARQGVQNILIIARNEQKLKDAEAEILLMGPSSLAVRRLVIDFARETSEEVFSKISSVVQGVDVGILVNNVGVSYPRAMFYDEVEVGMLDELINVNVRALLLVTRAVFPGMKLRKRGLVVCVGSGASEIPSDPLYTAYVATKALVEGFCRSLQVEAAGFGVEVQCHVPLLVTTKLSMCKTPTLMTPSEKTYALAAVKSMRQASCCNPSTVSPYWIHWLIIAVARAVPRVVWNALRLRQCLALRQRALKKIGTKKDS